MSLLRRAARSPILLSLLVLLLAGQAQTPAAQRLKSLEEICGPAVSPEAPRALADGPLILGYRADAAPFSSVGPNGAPAGYTVGLCHEIAERVAGGGGWEFSEVTAENRFAALASGAIDLLCDSSTLTLERGACFGHTLLVFPSGPSLAVVGQATRSLAPRKAKRLGVLADSSTRQRLLDPAETRVVAAALGIAEAELEVVAYPSYAEMFEAISPSQNASPTLDAVFADREILLAEARRQDRPPFTVRDEYLGYEPYTIFMRHDDPEFRLAVDAAMVEIFNSQTIHRLLNENFASRLATSVGQLVVLQRLPTGDIYASP